MSYGRLQEESSLDSGHYIRGATVEDLELRGYRKSTRKLVGFYSLAVLTLGFLLLVSKWKPDWYVFLACSRATLRDAEILILKDVHDCVFLVEIRSISTPHSLISSVTNSTAKDTMSQGLTLRFFLHERVRYLWNSDRGSFYCLRGLDEGITCLDLLSSYTGYSECERQERACLYGPNMIEIEEKSLGTLFVEEVLNPFYVFQLASIAVWIIDEYYYYALCVLFMSALSVSLSLREIRKQRQLLRRMVMQSNEAMVSLVRPLPSGETEVVEIASSCLVPGDVICIPRSGYIMPCDAVLTAGNCLVNESVLTGESAPVYKTAVVPNAEKLSPDKHKRHVLFSGCEVIQTRYFGGSRVTAVVIRTGFATAKGDLVRSMLFPQPTGFKFYKDAIKFVGVLSLVACAGTAYTLYVYATRHVAVKEMILRALDIVTTVVPPALPAAMTVGTVYAQARLRKKAIFSVSPQRINVAGKVNVVCFDKTGTLTEEGLDVWGVVPSQNKVFTAPLSEPSELRVEDPLLAAMATCHTLTVVDGTVVGDPVDLAMFLATKWDMEDPNSEALHYDVLTPIVLRPPPRTYYTSQDNGSLRFIPARPPIEGTKTLPDVAAGCQSQERDTFLDDMPYEIGIVRRFPFSSSLQLTSVVCRTLGATNMHLYVKGAPEKISSLCKESTVPENFYDTLHGYAMQGFRVIALGYRTLPRKLTWHHVQRINREELERELHFLGLLIMENMLKPESTPVIHALHGARIKCLMATGDNLVTALSVARDCDMVPGNAEVIVLRASFDEASGVATVHSAGTSEREGTLPQSRTTKIQMSTENIHEFHLAVDGRSFSTIRSHFPDLHENLLVRGTIFARMLPEQKEQLVQDMQKLGYVVCMCGDGANDCGSLKAADVGISLSEAESSVAAPFTSAVANIHCVPIIVREGRCALVTAFQIFRFIALYSLVQFISVILLYGVQTNMSDPMFLYVDLFVITTLAVTMCNTQPFPVLVPKRPPCCLVSFTNILSVALQLVLVILVQMGMLLFLSSQDWYIPIKHDPNVDVYDYWDTATVFFISTYQYLIMAVVFSRGPPFQSPFWTSKWFLGNLITVFLVTTFLLFGAYEDVHRLFEMVRWEPGEKIHLRWTIFLISCLSLVISHIIEEYVTHSQTLKRLFRRAFPKSATKNRYKAIEKQLFNKTGFKLSRRVTSDTTTSV